jgi:hypothetical protein
MPPKKKLTQEEMMKLSPGWRASVDSKSIKYAPPAQTVSVDDLVPFVDAQVPTPAIRSETIAQDTYPYTGTMRRFPDLSSVVEARRNFQGQVWSMVSGISDVIRSSLELSSVPPMALFHVRACETMQNDFECQAQFNAFLAEPFRTQVQQVVGS